MFLTLSSPARRARGLLSALFAALVLSGCGYNTFQQLDEQVKAAWSEVLNQYQRRADLIPNLVATVKGEANFEQETLTRVIEARAKATSIQATPELVNDPEAFDKFQKAQGELSGALSRLLVVAEQYPNLRGNLLDDAGGLHKFVNVYKEDDDIRYLDQLDTKVADGDTISILPAVAGG